MDPIRHPSTTRILAAPPNGGPPEARPIRALHVVDACEGGHKCVKSFWQPTYTELLTLQAGGLVELAIVGPGMPPVQLRCVDAP